MSPYNVGEPRSIAGQEPSDFPTQTRDSGKHCVRKERGEPLGRSALPTPVHVQGVVPLSSTATQLARPLPTRPEALRTTQGEAPTRFVALLTIVLIAIASYDGVLVILAVR